MESFEYLVGDDDLEFPDLMDFMYSELERYINENNMHNAISLPTGETTKEWMLAYRSDTRSVDKLPFDDSSFDNLVVGVMGQFIIAKENYFNHLYGMEQNRAKLELEKVRSLISDAIWGNEKDGSNEDDNTLDDECDADGSSTSKESIEMNQGETLESFEEPNQLEAVEQTMEEKAVKESLEYSAAKELMETIADVEPVSIICETTKKWILAYRSDTKSVDKLPFDDLSFDNLVVGVMGQLIIAKENYFNHLYGMEQNRAKLELEKVKSLISDAIWGNEKDGSNEDDNPLDDECDADGSSISKESIEMNQGEILEDESFEEPNQLEAVEQTMEEKAVKECLEYSAAKELMETIADVEPVSIICVEKPSNEELIEVDGIGKNVVPNEVNELQSKPNAESIEMNQGETLEDESFEEPNQIEVVEQSMEEKAVKECLEYSAAEELMETIADVEPVSIICVEKPFNEELIEVDGIGKNVVPNEVNELQSKPNAEISIIVISDDSEDQI
uniref:PHD-type domain-containing protein n=1 Tax=Rhabditophanes sp. KR3021 TaxID=114890 RepID=A0AC35UBQ4_9BILA